MLKPNVLDDLNAWNKAEKLNKFAGNLSTSFGGKGRMARHSSEPKDEFERMTDWKRTFTEVWTEIKWLKTFG
jgi:hypothetical protein